MLAIKTFIPNIFLILLVTLPIKYTKVIEKYNFAMHYFKNFSNAVLFTGFFEDFQMFFFRVKFPGFFLGTNALIILAFFCSVALCDHHTNGFGICVAAQTSMCAERSAGLPWEPDRRISHIYNTEHLFNMWFHTRTLSDHSRKPRFCVPVADVEHLLTVAMLEQAGIHFILGSLFLRKMWPAFCCTTPRTL